LHLLHGVQVLSFLLDFTARAVGQRELMRIRGRGEGVEEEAG
jgi:hypothetical protein